MTQDIYEQHKKSFPQVSAFVVADKKGERVATIAFKFPRDGAGRLYCYLHFIGLPMIRGQAGGYGYDKRSAAVQDAISRAGRLASSDARGGKTYSAFAKLSKEIEAGSWDNVLLRAGFKVWSAV